MVGVGGDVELLLAHRRTHVEPAVVDRERDEPRLEVALAHGVGHLGRVLAQHAHADLRVALAELLDEAGEQVVVRRAEGAEGDRARAQVADLADGVGGLGRLGERALGVRDQQPSRLGQREPAAGAREQRDAELGLEPADLLGEARLGHVQLLRGGGEGAALGGGQEIGELLQRHIGRTF